MYAALIAFNFVGVGSTLLKRRNHTQLPSIQIGANYYIIISLKIHVRSIVERHAEYDLRKNKKQKSISEAIRRKRKERNGQNLVDA